MCRWVPLYLCYVLYKFNRDFAQMLNILMVKKKNALCISKCQIKPD